VLIVPAKALVRITVDAVVGAVTMLVSRPAEVLRATVASYGPAAGIVVHAGHQKRRQQCSPVGAGVFRNGTFSGTFDFPSQTTAT
jgi:hypothetical protein